LEIFRDPATLPPDMGGPPILPAPRPPSFMGPIGPIVATLLHHGRVVPVAGPWSGSRGGLLYRRCMPLLYSMLPCRRRGACAPLLLCQHPFPRWSADGVRHCVPLSEVRPTTVPFSGIGCMAISSAKGWAEPPRRGQARRSPPAKVGRGGFLPRRSGRVV